MTNLHRLSHPLRRRFPHAAIDGNRAVSPDFATERAEKHEIEFFFGDPALFGLSQGTHEAVERIFPYARVDSAMVVTLKPIEEEVINLFQSRQRL